MKKLRKLDLNELAKAISVIPESELSGIVGAYNGDCFWRCVASILNGGGPVSEVAAASYALDYFTGNLGSSHYTDYYLSISGAGISIANARNYVQENSMGGKIVFFFPNEVSAYSNAGYESMSGAGHYAVAIGGSIIYDPQLGQYFDVSNDMNQGKFTRLK
jgi:hypothetical protein